MTVPDLDKSALAAGFVTSTLTDAEAALAVELIMSDPDFAILVKEFQDRLEAEGDGDLPERVWQGIERQLTGRRN